MCFNKFNRPIVNEIREGPVNGSEQPLERNLIATHICGLMFKPQDLLVEASLLMKCWKSFWEEVQEDGVKPRYSLMSSAKIF